MRVRLRLSTFESHSCHLDCTLTLTVIAVSGIYVPTLANRILDGNAAGNAMINIKGIAVGDGCIGNSVGTCGDGGDALQIIIDFYYGPSIRRHSPAHTPPL